MNLWPSGYERAADDAYFEPAWCADRLFNFLGSNGILEPNSKIWDPACGTGVIVEAARRAGHRPIGTDIVRRWPDGTKGYAVRDFLRIAALTVAPDIIVTNPPYKQSLRFVERALALHDRVAMLMPMNWLYGAERSRWLETTPLDWILPLVPRPSMPPIGSDKKASGGKTDFSWLVWTPDGRMMSPSVHWLRR